MDNCQDKSGEGFLLGTALAGTVAAIATATKSQQHQQQIAELESLIAQLNDVIRQQNGELLMKNISLSTRDSTITKLNADIVCERVERAKAEARAARAEQTAADLAAANKALQLVLTTKMFPRDDEGLN